MRTAISTPSAPAAIGPYSQAIQAGSFLFCSGQGPMDPATGQMVEGDIAAKGQDAGYFIGIQADGLLAVKDAGSVPLKDRNKVAKLVAAENKDRESLYQAIANANGHPEWAAQIKSTFAARWVSNAQAGWWYQSAGTWKQK